MSNVEPAESADILHVHAVSPKIPRSYKVLVEINGVPITMELDTGAGVTLVSEITWSKALQKPELHPCTLELQSYPDHSLDVLGLCIVQASLHGKRAELPLVVVRGNGVSLLGRNWLQEVKLDWSEVARVNGVNQRVSQRRLDELLKTYEDIFKEEIGHCQGIKARIHVKPEAVPKFHKPRPIPLAMKAKVEADLARQEKLGILEKIETSEWAAPIVPVPKPNGTVRTCGDYKVTVNPYLDVNQYPLPRPEELFAALNGGRSSLN